MSAPPACIVQVPLLTDWLPVGVGLPMSAQVQPAGQTRDVLTFTVSKVADPMSPPLCDDTTRPAMFEPLMLFIVILDPGTSVQVLPSLEVKALYVLPERMTIR